MGGVDPEVGKMDGAGGPLRRGVNDGGVVADRRDLIFGVEGQDHGVMKKRFAGLRLRKVPTQAVADDGQGLHFMARAEQLGEFCKSAKEKRIGGRFHQVELDTAQVGGGGALVSGGEVFGDELGGVNQTKAGA